MDDRPRGVESTVRELEQSLRAVERRLAAVEHALAISHTAAPPEDHAPAPLTRSAHDPVIVLSYIGRTFVALGGAYLLRALTDSAVLPQAGGVALGLTYALLWLAMADRAAAGGRRLSAGFHGLVCGMIAFPLIWEAVSHFHLIGPEAAAAAVTATTAVMLAVAIRQRLQTLAWIAVTPALGTLIALVAATSSVLPFAVAAIALALGTLWIGYAADWVLLRWPAALVADLLVLALAARVSSHSWPDPPAAIIAVQLLLLTGFVASVVARTLIRGRDVIVFEVVQTGLALLVGFGGALYVAQSTGSGAHALSGINLAVGAACYGVALAFVARRQGLRRNFHFYTSLGLVLVLVSTALLLTAGRVAILWTLLAVLAAWLAARTHRTTLSLHAAVYLIAAATTSGLLSSATIALVGSTQAAWTAMPALQLLVIAGALACWAMPIPSGEDPSAVVGRVPRVLIAVVASWAICGWMVSVLAPPLSGVPGPGADAGVIATVRTSVLAAAALLLAWAGRHARFRESVWLLYPLLVAGGLKLLVEDLPRSRPATLFIALALYGGALIVAPRLGRVRPGTKK